MLKNRKKKKIVFLNNKYKVNNYKSVKNRFSNTDRQKNDFRFLIYTPKNIWIQRSSFFDASKLDKFPIFDQILFEAI